MVRSISSESEDKTAKRLDIISEMKARVGDVSYFSRTVAVESLCSIKEQLKKMK